MTYGYGYQSGMNYQPQSPITWVQGEAGAKSYMVQPGTSALLMDSESQRFYIKTADQQGMPMQLRIFDYTERSQQCASEYATKSDILALEEKLTKMLKEAKISEPSVRAAEPADK